MNKEFIPYEQALELKELGFDEGYYFARYADSANLIPREEEDGWAWHLTKSANAPLYQQVFRWFRENYDLFGCIDLQACSPSHWFIRIDKIEINDYLYHSEDENVKYNTYEEAELACLKKLIETVKQKL